jgi:hypothetical protein
MLFFYSIWRRAQWHVSVVALALTWATGLASAQTVQSTALVRELQQGGYVIVFRHSLTDPNKPDRENIDLNDCATQRVLTDRGRVLARTIGTSFDRLNIPVDKVYGSPLCRTTWTADLAFGRPVSGSNNVIVTHGFNINSITGYTPDEGEAAIFKPDGNGAFTFVTRVKAAQWEAL